jgi:hypothetical protein
VNFIDLICFTLSSLKKKIPEIAFGLVCQHLSDVMYELPTLTFLFILSTTVSAKNASSANDCPKIRIKKTYFKCVSPSFGGFSISFFTKFVFSLFNENSFSKSLLSTGLFSQASKMHFVIIKILNSCHLIFIDNN